MSQTFFSIQKTRRVRERRKECSSARKFYEGEKEGEREGGGGGEGGGGMCACFQEEKKDACDEINCRRRFFLRRQVLLGNCEKSQKGQKKRW